MPNWVLLANSWVIRTMVAPKWSRWLRIKSSSNLALTGYSLADGSLKNRISYSTPLPISPQVFAYRRKIYNLL